MITYEFNEKLKLDMQSGQMKIVDFDLDSNKNVLMLTALNAKENKIAYFRLQNPSASNVDFEMNNALVIAAGISDFKNTYGNKYFLMKYLLLQDSNNAENKIILSDGSIQLESSQGGQ